jgi:OOP family OmpA-OmpF porin
MLTAIQAFIHDSFDLQKDSGIREIHAGDFNLWVEQGPLAALAVAVRGNAPVELRDVLRAAIDLIHEEFGTEIRRFQGDSRPFEQRCNRILEGCLQSRFEPQEKTSYWRLWLCLAILVAVLVSWGGLHIRQTARWNKALVMLRAAPGITVTQSNRAHGTHVLEGLRDPLAVSPESVLAANGIDLSTVSIHFQPFISLDPKLLIKRARATIQAPDSVGIYLNQDVLTLEGTASHSWILSARNAGEKLAIVGIHEVRIDRLGDKELESLRTEIEGERVLFEVGSSTVLPEQARLIIGIIPKLKRWVSGALAIGRIPRVDVTGHTDQSGSEVANSALSKERAQHVVAILLGAGLSPDLVTFSGAGSVASGGDETAKGRPTAAALRRRVAFRLFLGPSAIRGERL